MYARVISVRVSENEMGRSMMEDGARGPGGADRAAQAEEARATKKSAAVAGRDRLLVMLASTRFARVRDGADRGNLGRGRPVGDPPVAIREE
jgi:hypothetical protein